MGANTLRRIGLYVVLLVLVAAVGYVGVRNRSHPSSNGGSGAPSSGTTGAPGIATGDQTGGKAVESPAAQSRLTCSPRPDPTVPPLPEESLKEGRRFVIDAGKSCVAYMVGETFADVKIPTKAIGATSAISGALVVGSNGTMQASTIRVDVRTLESDAQNRDRKVPMVLRTQNFPYAEFTLQGGGDLQLPPEGQSGTVTLKGTMRIAGVERPVSFTGQIQQKGTALYLEATGQVTFEDFELARPSLLGFVDVENVVELYVRITAQTTDS